MKVLSGCGRITAIILIIIIMFLLPLTALLNSAGSFLFTQKKMTSFIDQSIFDDEMLAGFIVENIDLARESEDFQDDETQVVLEAFDYLDKDDFSEIINLTLPDNLVRNLLDEVFTEVYDWFESDARYMQDVVLDLGPLKRNIKLNTREIFAIILDALPECTPDQENQGASFSGNVDDLPVCRPSSEYYNMILDEAEDEIPRQLDRGDDEFLLIEGEDFEADEDVRTIFRTTKTVSAWLWLFPAFLILCVIPLGARSVGGIFKWAGLPLLFSGISMVLTAIIVWILIPLLLIPPFENVLADASEAVIPLAGMFIGTMARMLASPLLIVGLIMAFLGVLGLAVGFGIQYLINAQKPDQTPPAPPQKRSLQQDKKQERPASENESDTPEGMFG